MSIERNMNNANLNINNSIYTSQDLNYLGLNHCCNKIILDKDKYNNDLINKIKDMISKIDSKIVINSNNEQFDYNNSKINHTKKKILYLLYKIIK